MCVPPWSHLHLQEHKAQLFFGWTGNYDPKNILLVAAMSCWSQCSHLLSALPALNPCRDRDNVFITLVGLVPQMSLPWASWLKNWKTDSAWVTTASYKEITSKEAVSPEINFPTDSSQTKAQRWENTMGVVVYFKLWSREVRSILSLLITGRTILDQVLELGISSE